MSSDDDLKNIRPSQTRVPADPIQTRVHVKKLVARYGVPAVAASMGWTEEKVKSIINGSVSGDVHDESVQGRSDLPNEDSGVK